MLEHLDITIGFAVVMLILSLAITTIVHMISTALELRGKNLVRSLAKLVQQVAPGIGAAEAKKVADLVANHSAVVNFSEKGGRIGKIVSRMWSRPTKGITADEFVQLLEQVRKNTNLDKTTRDTLNQLFDERVPGGAGSLANATAIADQLATLLPTAAPALKEAYASIAGSMRRIEAETAKWFDTIMDRSSDWFATKVRIVTVIVAVVFAVALHIDSLQVIQQLSTNSEARAKLVQDANELGAAMRDRVSPQQVGQQALLAFRESFKGEQKDVAALASVPAEFTSCSGITTWLQSKASDGTVAAFADQCQNAAAAALEQDKKFVGALKARLDNTQLEIIPDIQLHWGIENGRLKWKSPVHDFFVFARNGAGQYSLSKPYLSRHGFGVLLSAIFLSLGAPFWYNALKQLASLRPMVAGKREASGAAAVAATPVTGVAQAKAMSAKAGT